MFIDNNNLIFVKLIQISCFNQTVSVNSLCIVLHLVFDFFFHLFHFLKESTILFLFITQTVESEQDFINFTHNSMGTHQQSKF